MLLVLLVLLALLVFLVFIHAATAATTHSHLPCSVYGACYSCVCATGGSCPCSRLLPFHSHLRLPWPTLLLPAPLFTLSSPLYSHIPSRPIPSSISILRPRPLVFYCRYIHLFPPAAAAAKLHASNATLFSLFVFNNVSAAVLRLASIRPKAPSMHAKYPANGLCLRLPPPPPN